MPQQAHHSLRSGQISGTEQHDHPVAGPLEDGHLAEGGEVVHYEVLSAMAKNIKNRQFSAKVKSILEEEQKHLKLCTRLAKQTATSG